MLKLLEGYPDNVLAIRGSGEITARDYSDVMVPAVENKLSEHKRVRLLYVLDDTFDGFTGAAAWEDAKVGMRHLAAFERVAVVSDADWVRTMVRGFGFAMPGQVKVYALEDTDDAREWISEPTDPGKLEFQLDKDRGLLVLQPQGELEAGDFQRVAAAVDPWLESGGHLKGIAIIAQHFPGWDNFAAFTAHLGFVRDHHRSTDRVALVTESHFLAALPRLAGIFVHAELRHFEYDKLDEALAWAVQERQSR